MPLVNIGGANHNVTSERTTYGQWPEVAPGNRPGGVAGLPTAAQLQQLLDKTGFGRPGWANGANARAAYHDHANTVSYGHADQVILDAACWNWALTGATSHDRHTLVAPADMFELNFYTNVTHNPATYLLDCPAGLTAFRNNNLGAVNAWIAMPEGTAPQIKAKMEALMSILCVAKGMLLAGGAATPYSICCEYDARLDSGPNFTHWGLQIHQQALQTLPQNTIGIWKNRNQTFEDEWTIPPHTDVARVPVLALTPAHLLRITGILAFNPHGANPVPPLRLLCSSCFRIHGAEMSWNRQWHQCTNAACNRIYCDNCGATLDRPAGGWIFQRQITQDRQCGCGSRTRRLTSADI